MAKYDRFLKSVGAWIVTTHEEYPDHHIWEGGILPAGVYVPMPSQWLRWDLTPFKQFYVRGNSQRSVIKKLHNKLRNEDFREQVRTAMAEHQMDQLISLVT